MTILPLDYYQQDNILFLSQDLLGKIVMTNIDGKVTGGMIVETEAYCGPDDRASHAYGNRRTKRNEVMYHAGGVCYIYLCYGIHVLLNFVTNIPDIPHAILIRAVAPIEGIEHMLVRRKKDKLDRLLTAGPGALTQALGITLQHNGTSLTSSTIWVEDHHIFVPRDQIISSPRIGIDYAKEDVSNPWRFRIKDNPWTSG